MILLTDYDGSSTAFCESEITVGQGNHKNPGQK